jgi:hypothetical protein
MHQAHLKLKTKYFDPFLTFSNSSRLLTQMDFTKKQLLQKLIEIHHKHSGGQKSSGESQICTMWPMNDPPDILQGTPPLDDIEEFVDYSFEELDVITFYDMNIKEACDFIWKHINDKG